MPAMSGKDGDEVVGYALSVSAKGFGGQITFALGLTPEGEITGISFTQIAETAGLGMKATEPDFKDQFNGKSGTLTLVKGAASAENEISAITGASITSNAVTNAVNAGREFFSTVLNGGT